MDTYLMLYIRLSTGEEIPVLTYYSSSSRSYHDIASTGHIVISQTMLNDNPNWLDVYRLENDAENVDLFWKPIMIMPR